MMLRACWNWVTSLSWCAIIAMIVMLNYIYGDLRFPALALNWLMAGLVAAAVFKFIYVDRLRPHCPPSADDTFIKYVFAGFLPVSLVIGIVMGLFFIAIFASALISALTNTAETLNSGLPAFMEGLASKAAPQPPMKDAVSDASADVALVPYAPAAAGNQSQWGSAGFESMLTQLGREFYASWIIFVLGAYAVVVTIPPCFLLLTVAGKFCVCNCGERAPAPTNPVHKAYSTMACMLAVALGLGVHYAGTGHYFVGHEASYTGEIDASTVFQGAHSAFVELPVWLITAGFLSLGLLHRDVGRRPAPAPARTTHAATPVSMHVQFSGIPVSASMLTWILDGTWMRVLGSVVGLRVAYSLQWVFWTIAAGVVGVPSLVVLQVLCEAIIMVASGACLYIQCNMTFAALARGEKPRVWPYGWEAEYRPMLLAAIGMNPTPANAPVKEPVQPTGSGANTADAEQEGAALPTAAPVGGAVPVPHVSRSGQAAAARYAQLRQRPTQSE